MGGIDDFFIDFARIDEKTGGIDDFLIDSARFVAIGLIIRLIQGLLDVGNQILLVFQTAGHTDETGGDSGGFELFVSHLAVCGGCGIEAASTRIGYVSLDGCKAEFFHKRLGCGTAALDYE